MPVGIQNGPVGLTPPNNGAQLQGTSQQFAPMFQQQQPQSGMQQQQSWQQPQTGMQQTSQQIHTISINQQPQSSSGALGGVVNSQMSGINMQQTSQQMPGQSTQIPTISMSFQQQPQQPASINALGGIANGQIAGINMQQTSQQMTGSSIQSNGIPQISIPSLTSSMGNMSMNQPIHSSGIQQNQLTQNITSQNQTMGLPQQQSIVSTPFQGEFFCRKMGNEDFYFNTDPIVSGLVFENTLSGIVCIGRIGTTVNNDGKQLPPNFREMIGHSFTLDHDNWLTNKGISKKDTSTVVRNEESVPEDYQRDDA